MESTFTKKNLLQEQHSFLESGLYPLRKELGSKFFPLRVDPHLEGKYRTDRVASLESVPIYIEVYGLAAIFHKGDHSSSICFPYPLMGASLKGRNLPPPRASSCLLELSLQG